jgi:hypothetical protein
VTAGTVFTIAGTVMVVAAIVVTPLGSVTVTAGIVVVIAGDVIVVAGWVKGTVTVVVLEQAPTSETASRSNTDSIFKVTVFIIAPHSNSNTARASGPIN